MPRYFFTARSLKGEPYSGTRVAKDPSELARILHREGYILISAISEKEKKKKKWEIAIPFLGVSLTEKIMFTRNLQIMTAAGIPLPEALKTLVLQTKTKKFSRVLRKIRQDVIKGKSFSESLAKYPDIFPEIFYNMIKVGEEAGTLEDVLKNLTLQMERKQELKSKIKGAMIYPAVIICTMIGVGILMLIIVVPKLTATFEELNIELPLTTRITIGIGKFVANYWYLLPFLLLGLVVILKTISKSKTGKKVLDSFYLKIPIISGIVKKVNGAYTARTLSALIVSGVPMVRSLEIIAGAMGNIYYKKVLREAAERVKKGVKLADCLRPHTKLYPPLVIHMVEVGEKTGKTPSILQKLADFFESEVTRATKNLSSVIEPVLMLLIGTVVGFFAVSMIQPMYTMLGAL